MQPDGELHCFMRHRAVQYLRELLQGRAEIFEAHPIALPTANPQPDIAVVRLPDTRYLQHHPYPEDIYWLVEVSDATLTYDVETKSQIYAAAGIREYWVIDIPSQNLIVFKDLQAGNFWTQMTLEIGRLKLIAFPELAIDAHRLLDIPKVEME